MASLRTYQEKAEQIAQMHLDPMYGHGGVIEAIRIAQVEAANAELEKRRELERQLENIKAGSPIIVCDEHGTRLKVWNPITKLWYETSLIACGAQER